MTTTAIDAATTIEIVYRTRNDKYLVVFGEYEQPTVSRWYDSLGHYSLCLDLAPSLRGRIVAAAKRLVDGKCDESHELHHEGSAWAVEDDEADA